jgi:hypothetical protein
MECSSHKIDGHSILLYEYTDRFNNKKANYVLPNRLHTIESQHFKYENRLRNRVPEERRSEITKYFKVLIDIVDSDN